MTVKLYYNIASPSARAVILTIKALGIPYELKQLDLLKKETLSEDFLQVSDIIVVYLIHLSRYFKLFSH